ncbi:MAG: hypothetical protein HRT36_04240, partial [Alphaproteobacteria bacterium]|nr:hypothetical protein [Alphaproteobacteria bacterium]
RWLSILVFSALLSACSGWQTVHVNRPDMTKPDSRLGQIEINLVYSVLGQDLYNALLDRQAKYMTSAPKQYRLGFAITSTSRNQTYFTDGSASVTLKRYTSNYTLYHGGNSQNFSSTTATTISQDNAPFNNTELEKKADQQAMTVLAHAMIKQLAVFLRQHPEW